MQLSNIDYWQETYTKEAIPAYPSQFAAFVQSSLLENRSTIVDLGCGNGRDSLFFHRLGHNLVVTDQVISENLRDVEKKAENFKCIEGDVVESVGALNQYIDDAQHVVIYSRFFQHAINETKQQEMLQALQAQLKRNATLYFEFRLDGDRDIEKTFGTSHYRRFQSSNEFLESISQCGFQSDYHCEGFGYARYKDEDPYVGRFIASPKKVALKSVV